MGWETTVADLRGASNLAETVNRIPHKAARLLDLLRKRGAGVLMSTPPWTLQQIDAAARRGAHKSASEYTEFVCEELLDFCRQGYWMVLPLSLVRTWHGLRLSPLGVVPQRNRRPRLIVDYSFSGVNQDTVRMAPPEAMQFGRALQRVLTNIVHADPKFGPRKLAKIDIADGFYRLWIRLTDILKLGVVLPTTSGATLVAFPLALPMGWVESPPYFTTMTETACDLANAALARGESGQPHHLEADAESLPNTPAPPSWPSTWVAAQQHFDTDGAPRPPLATADVFVDDFLLVAQTKRHQQRVLRLTLAAIDQVLRPLSASDPPHRKEPTSVKKLRQGDAHWSTRKTILGWDIDTVEGTLQLPPHRVDRLRELLDSVQPPRKRMSLREWHRLLGELRSMSLGLPGSWGLFSILQDALSRGDRNRIRLNSHVFACIEDFKWLTASLGDRPTRFRELVPVAPSDLGACDACRHGMGGVWFDAVTPTAPPLVWRQNFAPEVQLALVTSDCPGGQFSISDLELAATIAHKDILAQHRAVHERTIWLASNNKAAVSWATKGSSTSSSARAYLLRLNALHQHYLLDAAHSDSHDDLRADWRLIQETTRSRVSVQRGLASDSSVRIWTSFCSELGIAPCLSDCPGDRIPILQLFAHQYRTGALAPSRRPVRSRTVEDALRSVGQAFAGLGAPDPRLNTFGALDFRLTALLSAWKKADAPPARVKPLPLQLVHIAVRIARHEGTALAMCAADCLVIGFYFLLRPGEYTGVPRDRCDDLFRLQDVGLWIGTRKLDVLTYPSPELLSTTFATLTFTSQKNGVRGETIGHSRSGHPSLCPVLCLVARIQYLRDHLRGPTTALNAFLSEGGTWAHLLPSHLTSFVCRSVLASPDLGFALSDVSARSTRAGGAMALLCAGIDGDRIRLIGRWKSDEMYRYLHVQAQPVMTGVAAAMFCSGHYRILPGATLPTLPAPPP